MKTRLDQLTAAEFIDLMCGDRSVLLADGEKADFNEVTIALRNILMEYRAIADPSGNGAYLRHADAVLGARFTVAVLAMCKLLARMDMHAKARDILVAAGLTAEAWDDKRLLSEIHIRLQKGKRAINELDGEHGESDRESCRSAFGSLIAAMTAHFRFLIDTAAMNADIFAHLVARYNSEIKALRRAARK